jgi:hypothetical protein
MPSNSPAPFVQTVRTDLGWFLVIRTYYSLYKFEAMPRRNRCQPVPFHLDTFYERTDDSLSQLEVHRIPHGDPICVQNLCQLTNDRYGFCARSRLRSINTRSSKWTV